MKIQHLTLGIGKVKEKSGNLQCKSKNSIDVSCLSNYHEALKQLYVTSNTFK